MGDDMHRQAVERLANPVLRIFASTPLYLQGPGAIARVGEVAARLGSSPVIVIDALVRPLVGVALEAGFARPVSVVEFSGEVTDNNIARIAGEMPHVDVVIAVGGGKALDAGKAVSLKLGVPVVSVPTIASTDGPASRGIAMYDDDHRLVRVDQMLTNPAAVIVDTAVIVSAPVRFLRAGIGDAIAKKFEAEACWAGGGKTKHQTRPTHSARAIADACYRLLRTHASAAVLAAARHEVTEDVEATIEACVLLSAIGFENGGLSIAHSTTRGLMGLRGANDQLHGEHVAYGTLVQIATDGRPLEELEDLAMFLREVGLPASLADLRVADVTQGDFEGIADAILASPHIGNVHKSLTKLDIVAALGAIEAMSSSRGAQT